VLLVEGQALPGFELVGARSGHLVIKTGNQNVALRVFERGNHLGQGNEGIGRGAAIDAGVQIRPRPHRLQFGVDHAPQPNTQRRQAGSKHLRVGDQGEVGLELLRMFAHKLRDALAAHLLLAFEKHPHVDGQAASGRLQQRFQGLQVHVHLTLVVDRAAGIKVAVALGGLKGGVSHSSSGSGGWTS
jgi:hypothetical protein